MLLNPWINDDTAIHCVEFSFIGPKLIPDDASRSIYDVLIQDAELLASRILTRLQTRSSINEEVISSNYATVTFSTITAESLWGSIDFKSHNYIRLQKGTLQVTTNLTTGKETAKHRGSYQEKAFVNANTIFSTTYAASFYKAIYLAHISKDFEIKNPAAYVEINFQKNSFKDVPYIASYLIEGISGTIADVGFVSNVMLPVPSSKISFNVPQLGNLFDPLFNTYKPEGLIRKALDVDQMADISQPVQSLEMLNIVAYNGGTPRLFGIGKLEESINISERLLSYLTGHRGDIIWIFSALSRFFEYNGAVENSVINKNLRIFQTNLKGLLDSPLPPLIYPDGSPKNLTDLCYDWFGDLGIGMAFLLESLDPLRKNYKIEKIFGQEIDFNRVKTRLERVSPGLLIINPDLLENVISVDEVENSITLTFNDANGVSVKILPTQITPHEVEAIKAFNNLFQMRSNSERESEFNSILNDISGILLITIWLSNGDASKGFAISKDSGYMKISWPPHVLRRYSKLPIFNGDIKVWLAQA